MNRLKEITNRLEQINEMYLLNKQLEQAAKELMNGNVKEIEMRLKLHNIQRPERMDNVLFAFKDLMVDPHKYIRERDEVITFSLTIRDAFLVLQRIKEEKDKILEELIKKYG